MKMFTSNPLATTPNALPCPLSQKMEKLKQILDLDFFVNLLMSTT